MTQYINVGDIQRELAAGSGQSTLATNYSDVLDEMITEASRLVDGFKGVEAGAYLADTSATQREYFGSGTPHQRIDYCTGITSVSVEETDGTYTTWIEDTDFFAWPYESSAINQPIRRLDINTKSDTTKSVWTFGPKRVRVTATWGIATTVPETIQRAVKIQVQRWYRCQTISQVRISTHDRHINGVCVKFDAIQAVCVAGRNRIGRAINHNRRAGRIFA